MGGGIFVLTSSVFFQAVTHYFCGEWVVFFTSLQIQLTFAENMKVKSTIDFYFNF